MPRHPSPQTPPPAPPGGAQGVPRPAERHSPASMSWAVPWASSWKASRRHPIQMPELPQLAPLDVEEQRLYSKPLPDSQTPHPISKGVHSNPMEEAHFSRLDLVLSVMTQSSWS
ncbi:hypothetical protein ILYODFUR_034371 [Ilyodon furcidens]|uniref:Uncharacterized protein n=1 Tax=Ilyodon furcidens TaxID=33524 RepID=A0ABV0TP74_9TELE